MGATSSNQTSASSVKDQQLLDGAAATLQDLDRSRDGIASLRDRTEVVVRTRNATIDAQATTIRERDAELESARTQIITLTQVKLDAEKERDTLKTSAKEKDAEIEELTRELRLCRLQKDALSMNNDRTTSTLSVKTLCLNTTSTAIKLFEIILLDRPDINKEIVSKSLETRVKELHRRLEIHDDCQVMIDHSLDLIKAAHVSIDAHMATHAKIKVVNKRLRGHNGNLRELFRGLQQQLSDSELVWAVGEGEEDNE